MLSFLAYEYLVFLGMLWFLEKQDRNLYLKKAKKYKFLLSYNTISKMKKAICLINCFGIYLGSYILYRYIKAK